MNKMDEVQLNQPQSSVQSSESYYHHFHLFQSQLQRLEQRVHKLYKCQKQTQKTLDSHMLDESTQRQTMIKWMNHLASRLGDDSNSKSIKHKIQFRRSESTQVLDNKLAELRGEFKKEWKSHSVTLREEIHRMGKLENDMEVIKESIFGVVEEQSVIKGKMEKLWSQRSTQELEAKFNKSIEDGMNSIQEIIKNYINDQAGILIKIKGLQTQLELFTKGSIKQHKQIFELTPRDIVPNATPAPLRNSLKSATKNQTSNQKKSNIKEVYESSTDSVKNKLLLAERPSTLQRQSSKKNMSALSQRQRERSYSSKKITDLKEKLKQFEMINTKYKGQHSANQNYEDEALGSRASNASKPAKQAIQQLKQFKYMLENTESDMDISNTFNHEIMPKKPDSQPKYRKLDKVYHN